MHHPPALVIERLERARKTIFRRELPHHRVALPRGAPDVREPEEGKGRRQRLIFTVGRAADWPEVDPPGFIRVQLQSEPAQPLPEHGQHPLRILFVRKEHHKVDAEASQRTAAA